MQAVEAAFAGAGHAPRWPVRVIVERMPIMGATQSRVGKGHLMHVSLQAAESTMLDGLIAHEMGHIVRTEARHASHNKLVHDRAVARVEVPRAFARGFPRLARAATGHAEGMAPRTVIKVMARMIAHASNSSRYRKDKFHARYNHKATGPAFNRSAGRTWGTNDLGDWATGPGKMPWVSLGSSGPCTRSSFAWW